MYYIKKYKDCWAIHNDNTGNSRPLSEEEVALVSQEFAALNDPQVITYFTDEVKSIIEKP